MEKINHNSTTNVSTNHCVGNLPPPYLDIQYYYVCFVGSPIATLAIFENILVLGLMLGNHCFRQKTYVYQIVLAWMDIFSGLGYIFVLALVAYYEHTGKYAYSPFWHNIVIPGTVLARMAQDSAPYLLVAVSVERYLTANWKSELCSEKARYLAIAGAVGFAVFINVTSFWELRILHFPDCPVPSQWAVRMTDLAQNRWYALLWMFWFRSIASLLLPFCLLIVINASILLRDASPCIKRNPFKNRSKTAKTIRKKPNALAARGEKTVASFMVKGQTMNWARRAKTRVKISAKRTFVALVVTHLISRTLSVVILGFEVIGPTFLKTHPKFYTLASDTVSILSCLVCASRFPIYAVCDLRFRQEIQQKVFSQSATDKTDQWEARIHSRMQLAARRESVASATIRLQSRRGTTVSLQRQSTFARVVREAVEARRSVTEVKLSPEEGRAPSPIKESADELITSSMTDANETGSLLTNGLEEVGPVFYL